MEIGGATGSGRSVGSGEAARGTLVNVAAAGTGAAVSVSVGSAVRNGAAASDEGWNGVGEACGLPVTST